MTQSLWSQTPQWGPLMTRIYEYPRAVSSQDKPCLFFPSRCTKDLNKNTGFVLQVMQDLV